MQAGGAPTRGTVELVESAVPAELSTPGIAAVALLPALWLVGLAALAATALIAAVLIFARPRAEERILQDGPDADPVATGGDSASGGLDRLPG